MQNGLTKQKRRCQLNTLKVTKDEVKRKLKSMPDWKGAGPNKIQAFWLKSFTAVHEVLANEFL